MRLAILTNILTPYRMRFYNELNSQLRFMNGELRVYVMTDELPLRPWTYEDLKESFTQLIPGKKILIRGMDFIYNPSITREIKRFLPDIVIIAGSWTYPTVWKLLCGRRNNNVRYFFWVESHERRAMKAKSSNKCVSAFKKYLYMKFDGYCLPGIYAEEAMDHFVGNHGQSLRLPNLVDDVSYQHAISKRKDTYELRLKYGIPAKKRVFFCPARLLKLKGLDLFLKSAGKVKGISNACFLLAGEGPMKKELQDIADKENLDVHFMGYCNQDTVIEFYALSDFFFLPSLQDCNPLSAIEAAFAGLPLCVSIYTGNSPELIQPYKNGVVFDILDTEEVQACIYFLLNASEEWVSNAGRESLAIAQNSFASINEPKKFLALLREG